MSDVEAPVRALPTIETLSDLRWADADRSRLDARVKFAEVPEVVPYTFAEAEWPDAWAELSSRPGIAPFVPPPPPVIVVVPADLWRRTTEAEAEAIEGAMASQSAKLRNLFQRSSTSQSDDPLWPVLMGAATQLFGAARAGELLAPSA